MARLQTPFDFNLHIESLHELCFYHLASKMGDCLYYQLFFRTRSRLLCTSCQVFFERVTLLQHLSFIFVKEDIIFGLSNLLQKKKIYFWQTNDVVFNPLLHKSCSFLRSAWQKMEGQRIDLFIFYCKVVLRIRGFSSFILLHNYDH